jgi:transcriptional regulator with XRE-family HTH domain
MIAGMPSSDTAFHEALCDRFRLAQEATGQSKGKFARAVGLTPSQFTNITNYRNPPSHVAIKNAVKEFGFTVAWFYFGSRAGFEDQALADRLRELESR